MCLRNNNYCKKKSQEKTQSLELRKRLEIVHLIKKIIRNKIMSFQLKQFVLIKKKTIFKGKRILTKKITMKEESKVAFLTNICMHVLFQYLYVGQF